MSAEKDMFSLEGALNPQNLYKELHYPCSMNFDLEKVSTPAYLIDERALLDNVSFLRDIASHCGCHFLLAQKAFSCYPFYPQIAAYIDGVTASGIFEARLGREEMGDKAEVQVYSPAFSDAEFEKVLQVADKIIFNSIAQWQKYKQAVQRHNETENRQIMCGIRVNPEYSEVKTAIYDPASPTSRLGITAAELQHSLQDGSFDGLTGLHMHAMCEQNADVLARIIDHMKKTFPPLPANVTWINLGGGHHITKADYDVAKLCQIVQRLRQKTGARIYLEPGEAVALDAGILVSEILDVQPKRQGQNLRNVIIDASAACHMPDVLEMPYTPVCFAKKDGVPFSPANLWRGEKPGVECYNYRFGGPTCLAGDIVGEYSFATELKAGDRLIFLDMAIYSMVKNNTFNGVPLPDIGVIRAQGGVDILKRFGYEDFKGRLG